MRAPELRDQLSGFLYNSDRPEDVIRRLRSLGPLVQEDGSDETGWPRFLFLSSRPLFRESAAGVKPPFPYPILAWKLPWAVILLGLNKDEMVLFESAIIKEHLRGLLGFLTVDVQQILAQVLGDPDLSLSFAHVRMHSDREALSSMSYYGENLKRSRRFVSDSERFEAQTIRVINAKTSEKVMTIGRDGFLSFPRGQTETVSIFLTLLRRQGVFRPETHRRHPLWSPLFD